MDIKIGAIHIKNLEIVKILEFPSNGQFAISICTENSEGVITLSVKESNLIRKRKI